MFPFPTTIFVVPLVTSTTVPITIQVYLLLTRVPWLGRGAGACGHASLRLPSPRRAERGRRDCAAPATPHPLPHPPSHPHPAALRARQLSGSRLRGSTRLVSALIAAVAQRQQPQTSQRSVGGASTFWWKMPPAGTALPVVALEHSLPLVSPLAGRQHTWPSNYCWASGSHQ